VEDDYYPRQVGEKGTLARKDRRADKKRRAMRTELGREGSQKTIPDGEPLEVTISDLGSQLDDAAHIVVKKYNDLENLNKEKEQLQRAYNLVKRRIHQIGGTLWREGA